MKPSVVAVCGSMYTASMAPGRSELYVSAAITSSLYGRSCRWMTSLARSRDDASSSDGSVADSRATRSSCRNIACDRQPGLHLLGDAAARQARLTTEGRRTNPGISGRAHHRPTTVFAPTMVVHDPPWYMKGSRAFMIDALTRSDGGQLSRSDESQGEGCSPSCSFSA
eukprot:scaffold63456_cov55-Phaeocystis_antarctica.AAC.2